MRSTHCLEEQFSKGI